MLHVTLFERFRAFRDEHLLPLRDLSKAQELLVYLLLNREHAHTREALASLLWARCSTPRSKAYLRKTIWQLQIMLGPPSGRGKPPGILQVDSKWVQLNTGDELLLDVDIFERAYSRTRNVRGAELSAGSARALVDAAALYRGDLLPDRYHDWCLVERERLKHLFFSILEKLMEYSETHGEYEAGLLYGIEILRHDGAHERTHRHLMRLHALRGDRAGAIRQYQQCAELLNKELGVEPMKETRQLYHQIRDTDVPAARMDAAQVSAPPAEAVRELLARLDQLNLALAEIRRQAATVVHTTAAVSSPSREESASTVQYKLV